MALEHMFELGEYAVLAIFLVVMFVKFRQKKMWWYITIASFICAWPFEWLADTYMMVMDYSWEFSMFPGTRYPIFMAFSWIVFFAVTYILMDGLLRKRLQKLPKWGEFLIVTVIYAAFDFAVEFSACSFGLWTYYWPSELMFGGVLPITTPILVATFSIANYYMVPWAEKLVENDGFGKGFVKYLVIQFCVWGGLCMLMLAINKTLGVLPIPLDIAYSTEPLSAEMLESLCYRYGSSVLPPLP